jgi:hypothetical protein
MSYVLWWLLARRPDAAYAGLAQDLDFASDLYMIATKLELAACHLRGETQNGSVDQIKELRADQIKGLAERVARLARYADTQLVRSSGDALSVRRDAQFAQDLQIREFQERYAQLREEKAPESAVQEAIEDFRRQLRQANNGDIPVPPLAAIIEPVEAGCYRRVGAVTPSAPSGAALPPSPAVSP